MLFRKFYFTLILAILPFFVSAAAGDKKLGGVKDWAQGIKDIVDILIPLAFMLAMALFFFGIAKYIWSEGQGKAEGKQIMIWGVVALFVMSSVWGIVYFIQKELGIDDTKTNMKIPTINGSGGGGGGSSGGSSSSDFRDCGTPPCI